MIIIELYNLSMNLIILLSWLCNLIRLFNFIRLMIGNYVKAKTLKITYHQYEWFYYKKVNIGIGLMPDELILS